MISIIKYLANSAILLLFLSQIDDVIGHGGMLEPPMRSIAWRYGFDAPVNYDWMGLYCGGLHTFQQNGGRCGLCGDPYQGPYENDRGGVYDTGIIVRHYPAGLREIEVKVELTAHHKGYFRFKLCPNNEKALTKRCLDRYPLEIREGRTQGDPYRYFPPKSPKLSELHVVLPPDVTCDRCVLQWTYTAGNNAGRGSDGKSCIGCGIQETFVNCADVSIGGTRDKIQVAKGNGSLPRAGPDVVLPETADIVNIIRNAPSDRNLNDFFQDFQDPGQRRQPDAQRRPPTRRQRPENVPQSDPWFDRNNNDGANDGFSQHTDILPPDHLTPRSQHRGQDNLHHRFDNRQLTSDWDSSFREGGSHITQAGDGRFGHEIDRSRGHVIRPTRRERHNRRLDFAGLSNPTVRAALDSHFGQRSFTEEEFLPTERPLTSRDRFHGPLGAPPPSTIRETRPQVQDRSRTTSGSLMTNDRIIPGHGHHSTLLGSLDPLVSEINRRGHGETVSSRVYHESIRPHLSVPGEKYFNKPETPSAGHETYDTPSHSDHYRRISSRPLSKSAPPSSHLHNNNHPRREVRPSQIHREIRPAHGRFVQETRHLSPSRSQFRSSDRSVKLRPSYVPSHTNRPGALPRKIVVHDADVAQHLLKRFPVLRGRVYLSSRAHRLSKYASTSHRYRYRRW